MAAFNAKLEDIRLIVSIQGYSLKSQYIVRELGFWSRKMCGNVKFNCKINMKLLDSASANDIYIIENEYHGIRAKRTLENALPSSECSAVLRTLYHITARDDNYAADYIGILKDENTSFLLFKAGLGKFVFDLNQLDIVKKNHTLLYTSDDMKKIIENDPINYAPCELHESLRNNKTPICTKNKVLLLTNQIMSLYSKAQQNEGYMIRAEESDYQEPNQHVRARFYSLEKPM
jgi:hypothetical protein